MSEVTDDKVDKFHEALIRILYKKKSLVVVAIGIVLFVSWYVLTTYVEFDWDSREGELYLYRELEIVTCPCGRREEYVNFSIGTFVPAPWPGQEPWPWNWSYSLEKMTSWIRWTEGGFVHYKEFAWLAEAKLFDVRHIKRVMGYTIFDEHVRYKLTIDYYPALLSYGLGINATHEEILASDSNYGVWGGYLWPTAAQKFAELYCRLKMQSKWFKVTIVPSVLPDPGDELTLLGGIYE